MDGCWDYHTKWSKTETNIIWYHLYAESENNTEELVYKTEILMSANFFIENEV